MNEIDNKGSSSVMSFQSPLALIVLAFLAMFGLQTPRSQPGSGKSETPSATPVETSSAASGEEHASKAISPPLDVLREYLSVSQVGAKQPSAEFSTEDNLKLTLRVGEPPTEVVVNSNASLSVRKHPEAQDQDSLARIVKDLENVVARNDGKFVPNMECLIALVADPIDSHFQLMFDDSLSAITRGFATHNLVVDRHMILWADEVKPVAQAKSGGASQRLSRKQPSVILFRKVKDAPATLGADVNQLVMVLLVGETPTKGVHKEALSAALDFVAAWQTVRSSTGQKDLHLEFKLLGPEYSGSSPSLRWELCDWWRTRGRTPVRTSDGARSFTSARMRMISGSATSDDNFEILNFAPILSDSSELDGLNLEFNATVVPDRTAILEVLRHLSCVRRIPQDKIAFLCEANTSYAQAPRPETTPSMRTDNSDRSDPKVEFATNRIRDTIAEVKKSIETRTGGSNTSNSSKKIGLETINGLRRLNKSLKLKLDDDATKRQEQLTLARSIFDTFKQLEFDLTHTHAGLDNREFLRQSCRTLVFLSGRRNQFAGFLDETGLKLEDMRKKRLLNYPMTLSRMRSEYDKSEAGRTESPNQQASNPRRNLSLSLEQARHATDVLPFFSDVASAATDVTLEQILATISRDDIRAVGLMGTDPLDKLFLAQQIRAHAPDVQLFTFESNILYTHATYAPHLTGTLIASSYPLFTRSRNWTAATNDQRDQHFLTDAAQGVSNAAIALLNELGAARIATSLETQRLLDYSPPFVHLDQARNENHIRDVSSGQPLDGPSVWLTVVGESSMWPVAVVPLNYESHGGGAAYVYHSPPSTNEKSARADDVGSPPPTPPPFRVYAPSPISVVGVSVILLIAAAAFIFVNEPDEQFSPRVRSLRQYFTRSAPWLVVSKWVIVDQRWPQRKPQRGQAAEPTTVRVARKTNRGWIALVMWGALTVLFLVVASPFVVVGVLGVRGGAIEFISFLSPTLWLAVCLGVLAVLLWAIRQALRFVDDRIALPLVIAGSIVLCILAGMAWSIGGSSTQAAIFIERIGTYSSGVTPLFPLGALCVATSLWGMCHLGRMHFLRIYPLANPFGDEPPESARAHLAGVRGRFGTLNDWLKATFKVPESPSDWILAIVLASGAIYVLGCHWIGTAEGWAFDLVYRLALVLTLIAYYGLFVRLKAVCGLFERLLRRVGQHAMVDAFEHVPARLASKAAGQLFAAAPHPGDLDQPVRCLRRLADWKDEEKRDALLVENMAGGNVVLQEATVSTKQDRWPEGPALAAKAEARFRHTLDFDREHNLSAKHLAARMNRSFAMIARDHLVPSLLKYWDQASIQHERNNGRPEPGEKPVRDAWCEEAEVFVAMHWVNLIRQVFAHIQNMMSYLVAMLLCLLISLQSYPFQPRGLLLALWFGLMVWTVLVVIIYLVKFNRNEVLSRISNTIPNQFTWDRSLVIPFFAYVVTPIVGILLVKFPVLGRILFGWVSTLGQLLGT